MSETPENANTEPTTPEETSASEAPAQETDWQAEARKWEKRAKENKSAADKLAEIEESKKTEIEKAIERAAQAEERAQELERDKARLSVIATKQIPKEYHDLVKGDSEEELLASAEKVKSLIEAAEQSKAAEQAQYVIPSEGGAPTALPLNGDGIEESLRKALGI